MTIAIIGGGNMGEAFSRGIKQHFEMDGFELVVSEKNIEKHAVFHSLDIRTTSNNLDAVNGADVVVLAVKPVDMEETCRAISAHLGPDALVISIAAGVTIASLEKWLGSKLIVRTMPNLTASIGKSVTVWYAKFENSTLKKLTQSILESIGHAHEVQTEEEIDMATSLSGCGPAYVWYFMENMIAAGVKVGLDPDTARALTVETFHGATTFALREEFDPYDMRHKVAAKGGSTEQAIRIFDEKNLGEIIEEGVKAAWKKATELGEK